MHLSVIIPTRNRAKLVAALLDSLASLDPVPWKWETIVIDNGSTDETADLVRQKQTVLPIAIRYVLEERPGLHQGRNRGALEAKGEFLAYLDDDMLLTPTWLQGIAKIENNEADAIVGRIIPKWDVPPPEWIKRLCSGNVYGPLALIDLGNEPVQTEHFFGCNIFISRKMVIEFGGFHPDGMPQDLIQYRGDGETGFWLKMKAVGKTLWYSPLATAYHIVPKSRLTVEYMKKRAFNQGISDSFTKIRFQNGLYGSQFEGRRMMRDLKKWIMHQPIGMRMQYFYHKIKSNNELDREMALVQYEIVTEYVNGWFFHQNAVRSQPSLKEYVLSKSFLS